MIIVHILGVVGVVRIYFKWKTPFILEGHNFHNFHITHGIR
jgi:hypothetical protein